MLGNMIKQRLIEKENPTRETENARLERIKNSRNIAIVMSSILYLKEYINKIAHDEKEIITNENNWVSIGFVQLNDQYFLPESLFYFENEHTSFFEHFNQPDFFCILDEFKEWCIQNNINDIKMTVNEKHNKMNQVNYWLVLD